MRKRKGDVLKKRRGVCSPLLKVGLKVTGPLAERLEEAVKKERTETGNTLGSTGRNQFEIAQRHKNIMSLIAVRVADDIYCGLRHAGSMPSISPAFSYSTLPTTV